MGKKSHFTFSLSQIKVCPLTTFYCAWVNMIWVLLTNLRVNVDRKVQIVASHPKFDPKTFEYDLALLRFYEPVEFAPNVIPICIPEEDQELVGETAWVTGWGRLYEGKVQLF